MILKNSSLRIGLDLDDTCNYWYSEYLKLFGKPTSDSEITKNVEKKLKTNREFWLNLPIKCRPDFKVALYCTKRVSNKNYSKQWLEQHEFPKAPVYQMYTQLGNKARMIKGRVDVFVDDSVYNMIKMNLAGVPCLLMDSPYNREWGPIGRIYSLDLEEIEETYKLFMDTIYPNFKNLI